MDGQNYGAIQQFLANQGARRVANFQAGSQAVDHGMTNFLYRLIFGPMSRPGDGSPGALAQSFNPLHPAGLVNDLSMFVGGGKDMPEGFAKEMPGQFERYSLSKSPVRMQEGQPHDIHALIQRANSRASQPAAKMVHDLVFGGEVHAKGPIPSARLNFNKIREQAITEREKTGAELDAMGAKRFAEQRMLQKHNLMDPSEVGFRHLKGFTGLGSREHGYSGSQEFNTHLHDAEDFGSRHDAKANLLHSLMRRHYQPRDFYSGHNRMN